MALWGLSRPIKKFCFLKEIRKDRFYFDLQSSSPAYYSTVNVTCMNCRIHSLDTDNLAEYFQGYFFFFYFFSSSSFFFFSSSSSSSFHWHYSRLWGLACRTMAFHFFCLPPTLSIFLLPALEDLFLLPLSVFSWVFPFFSSLPVLE